MLLRILNTISLLLVIGVNYLSNTGVINSTTIGEVSHLYDTLVTPAGYTFSIWGVIYLLLIAFIVYQWILYKKDKKNVVFSQIGTWFILANLANISWVFAWLNGMIGVSVVIMLVLLYSLFQLVKNLNMENWNAPPPTIFFIWWPICIYFGWIIFASIANIAAYYSSLGWDGGFLSPNQWAILLIIASTVIYSLLIYKRNMREAAMVGAWGLVGIAYRQWNTNEDIFLVALAGSLLLLSYSWYHGYKNRATSPFKNFHR